MGIYAFLISPLALETGGSAAPSSYWFLEKFQSNQTCPPYLLWANLMSRPALGVAKIMLRRVALFVVCADFSCWSFTLGVG